MPENKVFGQAVGGIRGRDQKTTTYSEDVSSLIQEYCGILAARCESCNA